MVSFLFLPFKDPPKRTQSPRQRFKGTRCPHEPQSLEQNVLQKGLERKTKAFPRQKVPHVPSPPSKDQKRKRVKRTKSPRQRFKGTRCPHEPQKSRTKRPPNPPSSKGLQRGKQNKSNRELNNSTVEVPFFPFVVYKAPKRKKNWFGSRRREGRPQPISPTQPPKGKREPQAKKKGKNPPVSAQHSFFPSGNRARKNRPKPDPNPFPPPNHQKGKGNPRQRKREKPPRQCPTFLLSFRQSSKKNRPKALLFFPSI